MGIMSGINVEVRIISHEKVEEINFFFKIKIKLSYRYDF